MVVGSFCGWYRATEFKVSATSDTLLSVENDVVDASSGKSMMGGIMFIGWWTNGKLSDAAGQDMLRLSVLV